MTPNRNTPGTNCLFGFCCPRCGSTEPFRIRVTTMLTVYDHGGGNSETHEWDDDSFCQCVACGFAGAVCVFTASEKGGAP
jgi:hypothetical protein